MPKVSVIIPVYNVEAYLERCLDSVCNQTLKDIEIVCVNDCSTDNSLAILKEFSLKDKRIKIIDFEQNKGVATARNEALAQAQGEYVGFVDPDDFIDWDFFEKLYNTAQNTHADVAKAEIKECFDDGKVQLDLFKINENIAKFENPLFFFTYWFCGIYRLDLIKSNHIHFHQELTNGEDGLFLTEIVTKTNKISIANGTFYYYCRRENSANQTYLDDTHLNSLLISYILVLDCINSEKIDFTEDAGYNAVFWFYLDNAIKSVFRTNSLLMKQKCTDVICQIFSLCQNKNWLYEKLSKEYPLLLKFFESLDGKGLCKYLSGVAYNKFMTDNLRYKLFHKN